MDNMLPEAGVSRGAETVLGLQPNSSVSVTYHSQFGPHDDLMLLELDEKLLPDFLLQRVTLRGQPDEEAVLCTASKTYAVKFVGTSNSVFLIPPSDEFPDIFVDNEDENTAAASVIKVAMGCMELVEVAPKLDELRFLLSQKPYGFAEASETDISEERTKTKAGLFRWDDLVDKVQASDEELRLGLQSLSALEIGGYWRILDEKYMTLMVNTLLHNVTINHWSINALNEDDVVGALQKDGYPRNIAKHCFEMYCTKVDEVDAWKLDERRTCVHLARDLLKGGKMKLDIFMDKWSVRVPCGMMASMDMLEGEILTEKLGVETWIYTFSVSSLPFSPAERFSKLFQVRPKWEGKDLEPYIRDLRVPGLSSEGLLLKYTRTTQPNMDAEPVYSAR